jgi:hypothetical protein
MAGSGLNPSESIPGAAYIPLSTTRRSTRLGVYLKELLSASPVTQEVSMTDMTFTMKFSDLVLSSTNGIQRSTDLSSPANWQTVYSFVPTGSVRTWSDAITGGMDRAFYRLLVEP